jgi:hypothetical protein
MPVELRMVEECCVLAGMLAPPKSAGKLVPNIFGRDEELKPGEWVGNLAFTDNGVVIMK